MSSSRTIKTVDFVTLCNLQVLFFFFVVHHSLISVLMTRCFSFVKLPLVNTNFARFSRILFLFSQRHVNHPRFLFFILNLIIRFYFAARFELLKMDQVFCPLLFRWDCLLPLWKFRVSSFQVYILQKKCWYERNSFFNFIIKFVVELIRTSICCLEKSHVEYFFLVVERYGLECTLRSSIWLRSVAPLRNMRIKTHSEISVEIGTLGMQQNFSRTFLLVTHIIKFHCLPSKTFRKSPSFATQEGLLII